jgi:hypothetical protein
VCAGTAEIERSRDLSSGEIHVVDVDPREVRDHVLLDAADAFIDVRWLARKPLTRKALQ